MARLSDEFVRAVHNAPHTILDLCKDSRLPEDKPERWLSHYQLFCHFMPRRRVIPRYKGRQTRRGQPPKKIPRARWSKVRRRILKIAKIVGVPANRVFIEDDESA